MVVRFSRHRLWWCRMGLIFAFVYNSSKPWFVVGGQSVPTSFHRVWMHINEPNTCSHHIYIVLVWKFIDFSANDWLGGIVLRLITIFLVFILNILLDTGVDKIPFILFVRGFWVTLRSVFGLLLVVLFNTTVADKDSLNFELFVLGSLAELHRLK